MATVLSIWCLRTRTTTRARSRIGKGDGTFDVRSASSSRTFTGAPGIAELTGDGKLDLVFVSRINSGIFVLPGNGNGTFGTPLFKKFSIGLASYIGDRRHRS